MERQEKSRSPFWRRMRWVWFAFALLGLLGTPEAVMAAYQTYQKDHRFGIMIVAALTFRIGEIWFFFSLWWKYRPIKHSSAIE